MTTTNVVIHSNQSSTQYLVPTQNPSGGKENDPVTGWGNWTSWSNCSRPCGGCGNQTRQRLCYDPLSCRYVYSVLIIFFVDRCLSFCTFSFGHCVVCFFDFLRILITHLVFSNTSQYTCR